jgi:hypothetical protein
MSHIPSKSSGRAGLICIDVVCSFVRLKRSANESRNAKVVRHSCATGFAHARSQRFVFQQPNDSARKGTWIGGRHQQSRFALHHRFGNATSAGADDGEAHRHCVKDRGTETFRDRAHDEQVSRLHQLQYVIAEADGERMLFEA